jgi:RHS repeat-associated protein
MFFDASTVTTHNYGPFGEVIRATGAAAKLNPFRFSTKYDDDESDLLYYGYRYYNPSTGRWLSRDPIDEPGFELSIDPTEYEGSQSPDNDFTDDNSVKPAMGSLYGFVNNSPVGRWDILGHFGTEGRLYPTATLQSS